MDVEAIRTYWRNGAAEDLEVAHVLAEKEKRNHALFFCHLAVEKALKACVVNTTHQHPPKTHNLERLAEIAKLQLSPEQREFILILQMYCLEGRYPDSMIPRADKKEVSETFLQTRDFLSWLTKQS